MEPVRQSLFLIQFPTSAPFTQVEDWPRTVSRSCAGAIHVRPGGTKKVTATELEHLKSKAPWGAKIRVISKITPPKPQSETSTKDEKAARKEQRAREQAAAAERVPKAGATKGTPKKVASPKGNSEGSESTH